MTSLILFFVCIIASSIGAIVGAGGGVIIKPVLDMLGILPVSTVSFCSGCTVLGMSISSLIRGRKGDVKLQLKTSSALAVGAVIGGLIGKWLFEVVRSSFSNENTLGAVQAACLAVITFAVLLYICNKEKIPSLRVESIWLSILIGTFLGVISSFLGIGGGPNNIAILFFFFSMNAKEAAKNSLYIIVFSQLSSLFSTLATGSVPEFAWSHLTCMVAGGIGGALIGAYVSKKLDNTGVEKLLRGLTVVIILINIYNVLKYTILL